MWIGSIKLGVRTKDAPNAGTDSLVRAVVLRDGADLSALRLDYPAENDLERGADRNYVYYGLPRSNDQTPELPEGIGQDPMPYPSYGIEFSRGLARHLKLKLKIAGDDMWVKDNIDMYVRGISQVATSFDTLAWQEDSRWTYLATWAQDAALSRDSREGVSIWTLAFN